MVYRRKTDRGLGVAYSKRDLQRAVNDVIEKKCSINKASILFNIPSYPLQKAVNTEENVKEYSVGGRTNDLPIEVEAQMASVGPWRNGVLA